MGVEFLSLLSVSTLNVHVGLFICLFVIERTKRQPTTNEMFIHLIPSSPKFDNFYIISEF